MLQVFRGTDKELLRPAPRAFGVSTSESTLARINFGENQTGFAGGDGWQSKHSRAGLLASFPPGVRINASGGIGRRVTMGNSDHGPAYTTTALLNDHGTTYIRPWHCIYDHGTTHTTMALHIRPWHNKYRPWHYIYVHSERRLVAHTSHRWIRMTKTRTTWTR